jgi:hypothetical protein
MAYFKIYAQREETGQMIKYITENPNEVRTRTEPMLISGYNCQPETAGIEMEVTKRAWGKETGLSYNCIHCIQSFNRDEYNDITPELAHQIAREFVESCEQFKGFEVFYATNTDTENIHTHFIVNYVNKEDGQRFNRNPYAFKEMRDLSDEIVKRHGLKKAEKKAEAVEGSDNTVAWGTPFELNENTVNPMQQEQVFRRHGGR